MKKHTYLILNALELLALVGAWVIRYFSQRKMGMMRFVSHESRQLEQTLPMGALRIGCVLLLIALAAVVVVLLLRRLRQLSPGALLISAAAIALAVPVIVFLLQNAYPKPLYYYFISAPLMLAALLQFGKAGLVLRKQAAD